MLTDSNVIRQGAAWPPASEQARINDLEDNYVLHSGQHGKPGSLKGVASGIFKAAFERVTRDDFTQHLMPVNLFRLDVQTFSDLALGEPSHIADGETGEGQEDATEEWAERENLWQVFYEAMNDGSITGDGYVRVVPRADGTAALSVQPPNLVFPVVDPDDVRKPTGYLVAWTYNIGTDIDPHWKGIAELHTPGRVDRSEFTVANGMIASVTPDPAKSYDTGFDGLTIVHVPNPNRRSNAFHGISDFNDVHAIVAEIEVRFEQAARILDRHSDPSMSIPESAVEADPLTGEWSLKLGRAFVTDKDDAPASYLVWDGQLGPNYKMIDMLMSQYFTLTALSPALLGLQNIGAIPSGAALRRQMIPTLAKVNRWRMVLDGAIKECVRAAGTIEGFDVTDPTITWRDGLPVDALEVAQTESLLFTAGLSSVRESVARARDLDGSALEAEVDAITAAKPAPLTANPNMPRFTLGTLSPLGETTPPGETP